MISLKNSLPNVCMYLVTNSFFQKEKIFIKKSYKFNSRWKILQISYVLR